jgi:shikimate 5-dehydrogenase
MIAAGVIGWPIAQSKSPVIHRFWLDALGLDGDYSRFPVHPERLPTAIAALRSLGLGGVNATAPHKVALLPLLDQSLHHDQVALLRMIPSLESMTLKASLLTIVTSDRIVRLAL